MTEIQVTMTGQPERFANAVGRRAVVLHDLITVGGKRRIAAGTIVRIASSHRGMFAITWDAGYQPIAHRVPRGFLKVIR